ncbi:LVIVD repeat-containing protein [Candidatus Lokiarchaeum ossiferum]|uniref:LVIVD repeat-containing protein n=1 Tax=Candidatus Lokiarchaeum ossiferum TaxID=2951803 RepID=UPI00352CFC42
MKVKKPTKTIIVFLLLLICLWGSFLSYGSATQEFSLIEICQYNDGGNIQDLSVEGDYVYVADKEEGLEIIDVRNITAPIEVGQYHDGGSGATRDVYIEGNYAYVADGEDGLEIIDISDPTNPIEVGEFNDIHNNSNLHILGTTIGVSVEGKYAYICGVGALIIIIDISDPTTPIETGRIEVMGGYGSYSLGRDIVVVDNYAYIAYDVGGLRIINITDPTAPVEVAEFHGHGWAVGISVVDIYAYLGEAGGGLTVISISDPTSPFEVAHIVDEDPEGCNYYVSDVQTDKHYAYIANGLMGVKILDIQNRSSPVEVGHYENGCIPLKIAVKENYIYVADYQKGLVILNFQEKENESVISGYPLGLLLSSIGFILVFLKRKDFDFLHF